MRETKPAGPVDQAIYQAIADNYTRESAELGRPLSDFERVVLEYIAFNDGFINTRIRARQMLDGVGGERQGASAPTLGGCRVNKYRSDVCERGTKGCNRLAHAAPPPQAAEPKYLTDTLRSYFEAIVKYLEADLPGLALNTAEKASALLTKERDGNEK